MDITAPIQEVTTQTFTVNNYYMKDSNNNNNNNKVSTSLPSSSASAKPKTIMPTSSASASVKSTKSASVQGSKSNEATLSGNKRKHEEEEDPVATSNYKNAHLKELAYHISAFYFGKNASPGTYDVFE